MKYRNVLVPVAFNQRALTVASTAALMTLLFTLGCAPSNSSISSNNPQNPFGEGPAAVSLDASGGILNAANLGSAGSYVILAKTGVSNVPGSTITGSIGASPVAQSYITGFSLIADASNQFSTSSQLAAGYKVYAADNAPPTPSNLTSAIGTMETAYRDAAGRTNPDFDELATGLIGGLTLAPGLYKWSNTVSIPTSVTISGSPTDVWIFQVAGDLVMSSAKNIVLSGGAQAKNIYWQVAGQVTIGTTAHFEGIILSKTAVNLQSGATMNGRIFSQTMVSLDQNQLVQP